MKTFKKSTTDECKPLSLPELSRQLEPHTYLARVEFNDGYTYDQVIQTKKDFREFDKFIQSYSPRIARTGLHVISWEGRYVKFKGLLSQLVDPQLFFDVDYLLKVWGFSDTWRDVHKNNLDQISQHEFKIKHPPYEKEFEEVFYWFIENNKPDTITTLYHGTKASVIGNIVSEGFRIPKFRRQAFGAGIYFGGATKARNYAYPNWSCKLKLRFILEGDILLGRIYRPQRIIHNETKKEMKVNNCDSVYYNGFINAEWVVYNPHQILLRKIKILSD